MNTWHFRKQVCDTVWISTPPPTPLTLLPSCPRGISWGCMVETSASRSRRPRIHPPGIVRHAENQASLCIIEWTKPDCVFPVGWPYAIYLTLPCSLLGGRFSCVSFAADASVKVFKSAFACRAELVRVVRQERVDVAARPLGGIHIVNRHMRGRPPLLHLISSKSDVSERETQHDCCCCVHTQNLHCH